MNRSEYKQTNTPSTDPSPQLPFLEVPTGVSGHVSLSAGQTEGEGEGEGKGVGPKDGEEGTALGMMAMREEEGEGPKDGEEGTVLDVMAVREEEPTGVGEADKVKELCTVMRVTFSTACRGESALLPEKSLAVGGSSNEQPPDMLDITFVRVQNEL